MMWMSSSTATAVSKNLRTTWGRTSHWTLFRVTVFLTLLQQFSATWVPSSNAPNQAWESVKSDATGQYLVAIPSQGFVSLSEDFGQHWRSVESLPNTTWVSIDIDASAQYILAGNSMGLFYSWDFGQSWFEGLPYLLPSTTFTDSNANINMAASGASQQQLTANLESDNIVDNSATTETTSYLRGNLFQIVDTTTTSTGVNAAADTDSASSGGTVTWNQIITSPSNPSYLSLTSSNGLYVSNSSGLTWQRASASPITTTSSTTGNSSTTPVSLFKGIAMDASAQHQYATVENTVLYASHNFGANWTAVPNLDLNSDLAAIAANYNGSLVTAGSVRSVNGGVNFTQTSVPDQFWTGLCSDATGGLLVACSNTGIWVSRNFGVSWTQTAASRTSQYTGVTCSADGTKAMASSKQGGMWFSYTAGYTWGPILSPTVNTQYSFLSVAMATATSAVYATINATHIFILTQAGQNVRKAALLSSSAQTALSDVYMSSSGQFVFVTTGTTGYFYSNNTGVDFHHVATTWVVSGLAMSSNVSKVYACSSGVGLFVAAPGNTQWTALQPSNQPATFSTQAWTSISTDNTGMYIYASVFGGGIWTSKNGGQTWFQSTAVNNKYTNILGVSNARDRAVAITSGSYIFASQDGGTTFFLAPPSGPWTSLAVDGRGSNVVGIVDNFVLVSANGGSTYKVANITAPLGVYSSAAINSDVVVIGSPNYGLYLSHDTGLTFRYAYNISNIVSVAISGNGGGNGGQAVFALTSLGVLVYSGDLGTTWEVRTLPSLPPNPPSILPPMSTTPDSPVYYTGITVDDSGRYLTVVSAHSVVYYSNDLGLSWTMSPPGGRFLSILLPSSSTANYSIIVDSEVYQSASRGGSWRWVGASPLCLSATTAVLCGDAAGRMLYAGSAQCAGLFVSADFGRHWVVVASLAVSGVDSMACSSTAQTVAVLGNNGTLFLSTDAGSSWITPVVSDSSNTFITSTDSSAVLQWSGVSMDSTGQYITVVSTTGLIYTSCTTGQSWLPASFSSEASDVVFTSVVTSADGQYLTAVSSTGQVYTSSNYGYMTDAPTSMPTMFKDDNNQLDTKVIIAIVVPVGIVFLAVLLGALYYFCYKHSDKLPASNSTTGANMEEGKTMDMDNVVINQLFIDGSQEDTKMPTAAAEEDGIALSPTTSGKEEGNVQCE